MPVNTRRQTAGLSPLIKVSKKTKKKRIPEPIPASETVPIPVPEPITSNEAQNLSILSDMSISQQISHEVNQSQEELSIGEQSIVSDVAISQPFSFSKLLRHSVSNSVSMLSQSEKSGT